MIVYLSRNGRNLKKLLLLFLFYTNIRATEHSNLTTLTYKPEDNLNIGIKHDFPFINIRKVPREVLKTEGEARGFRHLARDLANVNE